jgi:hypothetical protein
LFAGSGATNSPVRGTAGYFFEYEKQVMTLWMQILAAGHPLAL